MTHLSKAPYRTTNINYSQSRTHIEEMLKEAGAKGLRWTETEESFQGKVLPLLEFALEVRWDERATLFVVRMQMPLLKQKKRVAGRYVETTNKNASMRLLYWYLKSRLEAVRFGLDDMFTAFMSRIVNQLPNGRLITLGETVKEHPEELSSILPSFEIKALPIRNQMELLNE
jgi:hypothetical protein